MAYYRGTAREDRAKALAGVLLVHRLWQVLPPLGTLLRSALACALVFAVSVAWNTSGFLLLVKLAVVLLLAVAALFLMGEFSSEDLELVRSLAPWPSFGKRNEHEL